MRVRAGMVVVLVLAGSTAAHAEGVYVAEPAPVYPNPAPYYVPAPVVVAPVAPIAPGYADGQPGYVYGQPYIVDYRREDGVGLNRMGIGGAGRHSGDGGAGVSDVIETVNQTQK